MAAPDSFLDAIASPVSEWVSDSFRFRMMRIHFGSVFERCTRVQHWLPKHSRRGVCKKWNNYLCALRFTELKKIGAFLDEGVWSKLTSWINWKHKVFCDVFLGCGLCMPLWQWNPICLGNIWKRFKFSLCKYLQILLLWHFICIFQISTICSCLYYNSLEKLDSFMQILQKPWEV